MSDPGQHLVEVHDMFRRELSELRELLAKVREGAMSAGDARSGLNAMAMRQNDWTLGAVCSRYCSGVTHHHHLEDEGIFPHLRRSDASLGPALDRLAAEHLEIHDAIEAVDTELVRHMSEPTHFEGIEAAIEALSTALLSHFDFEEAELVEPLSKHGFFAGQL
ncbi:MAG: hemerythrin domain-containing protein [Actinomycetota bacterium]|nr:hemerythrin domain-containing protein [Actinomycetota bacterium]